MHDILTLSCSCQVLAVSFLSIKTRTYRNVLAWVFKKCSRLESFLSYGQVYRVFGDKNSVNFWEFKVALSLISLFI